MLVVEKNIFFLHMLQVFSEETSEEPDVSSLWQTVKRRRAHSLDLAEQVPGKPGQRGQNPQEKVPVTATNVVPVTEVTQHEAAQRETSVESRHEGSSQPKGKGRDPHEWGNVHLSEHEMDTAMQQAAYESYKK
jgi:hypothetical protein